MDGMTDVNVKPKAEDEVVPGISVQGVGAMEAEMYADGGVLSMLVPWGSSSNNSSGDHSNVPDSLSYTQILPHVVNVAEVLKLKDFSTHHEACVATKKNCAVGLGFFGADEGPGQENAKDKEGNVDAQKVASLLSGGLRARSTTDEVLDPLTDFGFADVLNDWVEDFIDTGSAYLEVVRRGDKIRYIGVLSAADVYIGRMNQHVFFAIKGSDGQQRYFSKFGKDEKKWLLEEGPYKDVADVKPDEVSEIIYLRQSSNKVKFYGWPDWLAASIDIELLKKAKQYKKDFYDNRCGADFFLALIGANLDPKEWKAFTDNVQSIAGSGRAYRNICMQIQNQEASVEMHKLLADQQTEEQFKSDNEVLSQNIVSAHGVPPLLANILIPGKLGGSNEFVNSLVSFQLLRIGPMQRSIQDVLSETLGNSKLNGGLKLDDKNFQLRTITSQLNIGALDTISKIRESAVTTDRDLEKGTRD
jgi:capsid portal protein